MSTELILIRGSKHWYSMMAKGHEYWERIAGDSHADDPFMLACEHAKLLILNMLIDAGNQPVHRDQVEAHLNAHPEQAKKCRYFGPPAGYSVDEAWKVIDRYINHQGEGLAGGTGLPLS